MRSEIPTVAKMSLFVFWVITLCRFVGIYRRFGGIYCLLFMAEISSSER